MRCTGLTRRWCGRRCRVGERVHPIDAFILAKLVAKKVAPSPEAPKAKLRRRLAPEPTGDKAELAAWTSLCRVLLNAQETITRY